MNRMIWQFLKWYYRNRLLHFNYVFINREKNITLPQWIVNRRGVWIKNYTTVKVVTGPYYGEKYKYKWYVIIKENLKMIYTDFRIVINRKNIPKNRPPPPL